MDDDRTNHLQAWREFRRMTQTALAEAIGTTPAVISLLESGARSLSPKWLRRIAPVLRTTPGMLLDHDPHELDDYVIEVWASIPDDQKATALAVLQQFSPAARVS